MSATSHVIGVDIGGTKIAAGLVSFPDATVRFEKRIATEADILPSMATLVSEIAKEATDPGLSVSAIGIGICEIVDLSGKVVSKNAVDCSTTEVIAQLSPIAPVRFEADVRAAALAEALYGAGKAFRIFLYVTIGTGISACLMVDGKPFGGARGATGTIASSQMPCQEFTLEDVASGPGLVERYNAAGGAAKTGEDVITAASAEDPRAIQVIEEGARAVAATLGMLIGALDPEAIIIGGGLGLSEGRYRATILREIPRHIWWKGHRDIPILAANLGPRGPIIGAAAAAAVLVKV